MIAAALAEWAASWSGSLPGRTRGMIEDATVDTLGCIAAGRDDPATQAVRRMADGQGGRAESGGIGLSGRAQARDAALLNGTAAHALDFDDNFEPSYTHASAVLVPALLACAERLDSSGQAYAQAYLVGLEIGARVGRVMHPNHYQKGWHPTATLGVIAAAGACSRLHRMDAERTRHAMSIAFSLSAGTKIQFGTSAKPLHAGLAASQGILACDLAAAGMTGAAEFIAGPYGLADLYHGRDTFEPEAVLAGLGDEWALETAGLMPKRFPCCAASHQTLDMLDDILRTADIEPDRLARVEIRLPQLYAQNLRYDRPDSGAEARFSMPYTAACMLARRAVRLADFADGAWRRPDVTRLYPLIRVQPIPHAAGTPPPDGSVTVTLTDGTCLERSGQPIKGTLGNPFDAGHIRDKFLDCCGLDAAAGASAYEQARRLLSADALRAPATALWQALAATP